MKALYIYSFRPEVEMENLDFDWFVGDDFEDYDDQEMEVKNYMIENDLAEDYGEAEEKIGDVYKQDTKVLISKLQKKGLNANNQVS